MGFAHESREQLFLTDFSQIHSSMSNAEKLWSAPRLIVRAAGLV
jgi:hypothetical protein